MKNAISLALSVLFSLNLMCGCIRDTAQVRPESVSPATAHQKDTWANTKETVQAPELPATAAFQYLAARHSMNKNNPDQAETQLNEAIKKDPGSSFLKRELIRLYLGQKKTDQALDLAETLAAQHPDNADNLLMLARLKKGDTQEMIPLFKQLLKLTPDNRETYLRLGKIYIDEEKATLAKDLFARMVQTFPDYYVAHFYLGEACLMTGNPLDAEAAFLKTLDLEPELVAPRFRLIDIYQADDTAGAQTEIQAKILEQYESILETEPGNDRALVELALFHEKADDLEKADQLFDTLGQKLSQDHRLAISVMDSFISEKHYEDALIVLSKLKERVPGSKDLDFFMGMAHEALGHYDKAISCYLKMPATHPQYKKAMLSIAFLYREKDRMADAVAFLEALHRKDPADIDILSYLASFYDEQQRYSQAISLLKNGLEKSPQNTALMFKLGATQDKAGLRDDCIKTMKALLIQDPDHASALNYLGYTYAEMDILLEEALDLVQRALTLKPGDGYITDSLGWVYFKMKDYGQAVIYLEKAARISEYESIIADHLADAYAKNGQTAEALATYQKALKNAKADQKDLTAAIREKVRRLKDKHNGG